MSFFRAVIHLLMQCRVNPYIAYRGMAESQLKKSLPTDYPPKERKIDYALCNPAFPKTQGRRRCGL